MPVIDKAHGTELKSIMQQLTRARENAQTAIGLLEAATKEIERIERVLWAIGSELDHKP